MLRAEAGELINKHAIRPFRDDIKVESCWPIDPTRIILLGQRLDPVGNIYVVLPDGASVDATAKVPGVDFYVFDVGAAKYKLVPESLTFTGTNGFRGPDSNCYDILQDTNGMPYPTQHWTTNTSYPVLYVSGTHMRVAAFFRSLEAQPLVALEILGQTSNGQLFRPTNYCGITGLGIDTTSLVRLIQNRVDFCNPLYINWMYWVPGRTGYVFAGKTTNLVHVSLQDPLTPNLFHTVVHLACAKRGPTTEDQAVANTWSFFTNRTVTT